VSPAGEPPDVTDGREQRGRRCTTHDLQREAGHCCRCSTAILSRQATRAVPTAVRHWRILTICGSSRRRSS
jgi:hypothetical protein